MKNIIVLFILISTSANAKNVCLSSKDLLSCVACCQEVFLEATPNSEKMDNYKPEKCKADFAKIIKKNSSKSMTPPGVTYGFLQNGIAFEDLIQYACDTNNNLKACVNECEQLRK